MVFFPSYRLMEDVLQVYEEEFSVDWVRCVCQTPDMTEKEREFDVAAYGISALETALSLSYTHLVETGYITVEHLIRLMSAKPAEILKLYNKGSLAEGKDADIIVVDFLETHRIDPEHFASKAKFSPFAAEEVRGKVLYTMVGGRLLT